MKIQKIQYKYFILIILAFSQILCFGQKFYLKTNFSGGIGINGSSFIVTNTTYTINQDNTTSYQTNKIKPTSFGNGLYSGVSIGYDFNPRFSIELKCTYAKHLSYKMYSKDIYIIDGDWNKSENNYQYKGHSFYLTPSFSLSPGYEKINPYFSMGLIIGRESLKEEDEIQLSGLNFGSVKILNEYKYRGILHFGFQSVFGLNFSISPKSMFFSEIAYNNISYSPRSATLTKSTANNIDQLPLIDGYEKEFVFVDEVSTKNPPIPWEPYPILKPTFSFNTLMFNLGFKIFFNKKHSL